MQFASHKLIFSSWKAQTTWKHLAVSSNVLEFKNKVHYLPLWYE